jgi:hypothetical protein
LLAEEVAEAQATELALQILQHGAAAAVQAD